MADKMNISKPSREWRSSVIAGVVANAIWAALWFGVPRLASISAPGIHVFAVIQFLYIFLVAFGCVFLGRWLERNAIKGPRVIATHYGPAGDAPAQTSDGWHHADRTRMTTREVLQGKHLLGLHGLYLENEIENESAFDVSISQIAVGGSILKFKDYKLPRLTKADGRAFFEATIERSPGHTLFGSGLRDEMIQEKVAEVIASITYKDANGRWYLSPARIERDSQGLSVRPMLRQRISSPK